MTPVIIFLVIFGFWITPILFVVISNKVGSKEKFVWILAITFVSWFAWLFFALFAPIAGSKTKM